MNVLYSVCIVNFHYAEMVVFLLCEHAMIYHIRKKVQTRLHPSMLILTLSMYVFLVSHTTVRHAFAIPTDHCNLSMLITPMFLFLWISFRKILLVDVTQVSVRMYL